MKKISSIIFVTYLSIFTLNSQIHFGSNLIFGRHTHKYNYTNNSLGFGLGVGYSLFDSKIETSMGFERHKKFSISDNKLIYTDLNIKYKPFKYKYIKPYIGVGVGYFYDKVIIVEDFIDEGISYTGSLGLMFEIVAVKGLYINTEYNYKFVSNKIIEDKIHFFKLGLVYYLSNKNEDQ